MTYVVLAGIVAAFLSKRNPMTILHIELKARYVMIGILGVQILLAIIAAKTNQQYPIILNITFLGILVCLFWNRHLSGIKWILGGASLNFLALLLHGGLMPVSAAAMKISGLDNAGFDADSRHYLMEDTAFWWLGDWIPFLTPVGTNYVWSPGDVLVAIGIFVFLVRNSQKRSYTS
ncbi:DUF5317 domain-containing protein [Effusibacillus consociatus]|uniref:DUF5317 domain-containing protein n=1 Tax=Effusibacillus consociatus TaxID=1117041 RepID=A0ABV9Q0L3_9BACL